MPFDALVPASPDVLTRLGLVPVPKQVLDIHKATVQAAFLAQPELREHVRANAKWREYCDRDFVSSLWHNMYTWAEMATRHPVPPAIRALATETQQRATERGVGRDRVAHDKVIGWFYRDPYILFRWVDGLRTNTVCLAIWDNGKVLHLAKLT